MTERVVDAKRGERGWLNAAALPRDAAAETIAYTV